MNVLLAVLPPLNSFTLIAVPVALYGVLWFGAAILNGRARR